MALEVKIAESIAANRNLTEATEEVRKIQNNIKPLEKLVSQYDSRYEEAVSVVKKVG